MTVIEPGLRLQAQTTHPMTSTTQTVVPTTDAGMRGNSGRTNISADVITYPTTHVDPFLDRAPSAGSSASTNRKPGLPRSPESLRAARGSLGHLEEGSGPQVYVIHSDGGSVIDLPPTYALNHLP
jgi:hypothetical protein